jgi:phosphoribosylanthranilate isomerase
VGDLRVKVCGLTRREDALAAERAGADYLGVILSPGFSRSVPLASASRLVEGMRPMTVAVLVGEEPRAAEEAARSIAAGVIQLHGEEPPAVLADIRTRGSWKLWKAVRAQSMEDVERAVDLYGDVADGILVEGWKEGVAGGGGARLTLAPDRVRDLIPEQLDFILAGGLSPDNVAEAVTGFRPDVVDVSSGVERVKGEKDHGLVERFVAVAREAGRLVLNESDRGGVAR